jgi:hypothetical protein
VLIVDAGQAAWINRRLLSYRWLVGVGLISYPLYLWHWPLLVLNRLAGWNSVIPTSVVLIVSVICAMLTFTLVEKPIRWPKEKFSGRVPVAVLLSSLLIVGVVGHVGPAIYLYLQPPGWARAIQTHLFYEPSKYRVGRCLLLPQQNANFAPECYGLTGSSSAHDPLVVLWGDSHAGHLYPGLQALQGEGGGFALAQFTTGSCPPILDLEIADQASCRSVNTKVFDKIVNSSPREVILSAHWANNLPIDSSNPATINLLARTIRLLLSHGVSRVVVVGPAPWWLHFTDMLAAYQKESGSELPPKRMGGTMPVVFAMDAKLKSVVESAGGTYISVVDYFCEQQECLIKLDTGDEIELSTFDGAHLTSHASIELIRSVRKQIFLAEKPVPTP